jgi:surfeit locus 1 family protein
MSSTPADAAGGIFRPRLWPTLATLLVLVALVGLGSWQLQRLAWKEDLIAHAQAQLAAPAVALPANDLASLDYRRVTATGSYLHDSAFAFGFLAEDGKPGGRLITPLRLVDGRVILVDRGWMPEELLPPDVPNGLRPEGLVTLEGIGRWREDGARPWMTPADTPGQRRWYGWDISSIQAAVGLPIVPVELILERSEGSAGLPKAEPVSIDFPNDHLSYALTWYGLAVVLLAVYITFSFTRAGSEPS